MTPMRRTTVMLLPIMICGLLSAHAQPKIEIVGGNDRDFGSVYTGQILKHTLTLRNTGFDTLKISSVKASCGCTAAMASSHQIAPGDTATVSIAFNSTGYMGHLAKNIRIASNDSTSQPMYVYFKVNVLSAVDITPPFLAFVNYKIDSLMTRTVQLKNTTAKEITITKVTSSDPQVSAQLRKLRLKPGGTAELDVKLMPRKLGYFEGTISLKTDFAEIPMLTINFNAMMKK
jgi:hypothetical protein